MVSMNNFSQISKQWTNNEAENQQIQINYPFSDLLIQLGLVEQTDNKNSS